LQQQQQQQQQQHLRKPFSEDKRQNFWKILLHFFTRPLARPEKAAALPFCAARLSEEEDKSFFQRRERKTNGSGEVDCSGGKVLVSRQQLNFALLNITGLSFCFDSLHPNSFSLAHH
jgi:hypothetical protein